MGDQEKARKASEKSARQKRLAEEIGGRLKAAKSIRQMSLSQIREGAGITAGHWSRMTSGKRLVDLDTLFRVCTALRVDPGWIAFGVHQMEIVPQGETTPAWPGEPVQSQEAIRFARTMGVTDDEIHAALSKLVSSHHNASMMVLSAIMLEHTGSKSETRSKSTPPPNEKQSPLTGGVTKQIAARDAAKSHR